MANEKRQPAGEGAVVALLAALREFRVHDASPLIEPGMPLFFLYGPPAITPLFGHDEAGAAANRISMSEHTGTHVDAPFHFDRDGLTVDQLPPEALLLRPYKKFDLTAAALGAGDVADAQALEDAAADAGFTLEPGDVAIVEMGWDRHLPDDPSAPAGPFWGRNEPGLSEDACRYLAQAGVVAVASDTAGCDVPCVDGEMGASPGHSSWFLPRGILMVEGLRGLAEVAATGLFLAVPLKISGGTGSPVRVLLLDHAQGAPP